jgi:hypothetical protein
MEVGDEHSVDVPVLAPLTGDVAMMEVGDPGPQNWIGEEADAVHFNEYCSMANIGKMRGVIHRD